MLSILFSFYLRVSRWYSVFFVLYILLGVYFVTNLILAVVYDSFKSEVCYLGSTSFLLAKQVVGMDSKRRSILLKAFNLMDRYADKKAN
ncbi:Two pore calcium channel protein 1 [Bienertia sinuspersici]